MTKSQAMASIKRIAMIFVEIGIHPLENEAFSHRVVYDYIKSIGLMPIFDPNADGGKGMWTVAENKFSKPEFTAREIADVLSGVRSGRVPRTSQDCLVVLHAVHGVFDVDDTDVKSESCEASNELPTATDILGQVAKVMEDRAAQYDQKETGERSMQSAIEAFNAIKQTSLTAADGFLLMALLKAVRANTAVREDAILDSLHDGVAYFSLHGEAMMADKRAQGLL